MAPHDWLYRTSRICVLGLFSQSLTPQPAGDMPVSASWFDITVSGQVSSELAAVHSQLRLIKWEDGIFFV